MLFLWEFFVFIFVSIWEILLDGIFLVFFVFFELGKGIVGIVIFIVKFVLEWCLCI